MNPPFEVLVQGGAELEWWIKEDGRFAIRAICKICFAPGNLSVGSPRSGKSQTRAPSAAGVGYAIIKYERQMLCKITKRGWRFSGTRAARLSDICSRCSRKFRAYVLGSVKVVRHGKSYFDSKKLAAYTESDYRRLFHQWLVTTTNTLIKKIKADIAKAEDA